jgi:hypothetical protein
MEGWPISRKDLEPYFRKISNFIPLCGGEGNLSEFFPVYQDKLGELELGWQGLALLKDLKRAEKKLLEQNSYYGKSRLAIHTTDSDQILPCNGCGKCFIGCVRNSIFSTIPLLEKLVREKKLVYEGGLFVESLNEANGEVTLQVVETKLKKKIERKFDAVFIGGGPINTTRLLLKSKNIYDEIISVKESQKCVMPIVRVWPGKVSVGQSNVTQASVFFETKTQSLSNHWAHVQIIPMNEMIIKAAGIPWQTNKFGNKIWNPILSRVMMGWVGLHSDHSSSVELCLRNTKEKSDVLEIGLKISGGAREAADTVSKDLFKKGLLFRTIFCHQMKKISNPGSGTHCGSSFPMKKNPNGRFDTDIFGRPFGWENTYIVDSSVLPDIPGTTLAYTVMANAYRIADSAQLNRLRK